MINERFKTYFENQFFQWNKEEFSLFIDSLEKPIPRTIRIKEGKESQVIKRLEKDGWILTKTDISRVFSLSRTNDFDPLERRIGFSIDHLVGNFYIQELAAAHPVDILANWKRDDSPFLILDMASSPGGKTTQLREYFPQSFIIANEPTRERIPQLLQNLDRMGSDSIWITLYPGQYWKRFCETFDRILLDAPCSGEWTLYKWTDALKHWHIKNIKQIASLQIKLFDAALHALKINGEMVYSTCSLNDIENEWVLSSIEKKYPGSFEVLYEKKFWPQRDKTWGFYVVKIRKLTKISEKTHDNEQHSNTDLRPYKKKLDSFQILWEIHLFEHHDKILAVKNIQCVKHLLTNVYFMKFWEQIWIIEDNSFIPHVRSFRYIQTQEDSFVIKDDLTLDRYLRWNPLSLSVTNNWYILLSYDGEIIARERQTKDNFITNTFPPEWRRK